LASYTKINDNVDCHSDRYIKQLSVWMHLYMLITVTLYAIWDHTQHYTDTDY